METGNENNISSSIFIKQYFDLCFAEKTRLDNKRNRCVDNQNRKYRIEFIEKTMQLESDIKSLCKAALYVCPDMDTKL